MEPVRPDLVARVPLATSHGEFDLRAFRSASGPVYLAVVRGEVGDGHAVLTRLHSECLTGDALGSLRCDCGAQLREALRIIGAERRGILVYATGQEGRGIGLVEKLRAYALQDEGADTVDANLGLGLPVDGRTYDQAAAVLTACGVRSVRLLTNNPDKVEALQRRGITVEEVLPISTSPHTRNLRYLLTKRRRLGHVRPEGDVPGTEVRPGVNATELLGEVRTRPWRPYVVMKYAQTLDGRIATATGDSRWISGEPERRVAHALRAACDAVLVGVGTVVADDPQLTVRKVPGSSPIRVVLDSRLRIPTRARVLDSRASTVVVTTSLSHTRQRDALRARGVAVLVANRGPRGVDLPSALRLLRGMGIRSMLVEGGAAVITSMLEEGVVDRLIVSIAPTVIGAGTEAVGDLGVTRVADGFRLDSRSVVQVGPDTLFAGDLRSSRDVPDSRVQLG